VSVRSLAAALAVGTSLLAVGPGAATPTAGAPPIGHVFVIVLENEGYDATFGNPAADPYLAKTLPSEGALLTNYYGIGHVSNDNYIAMVSGQGPNPDTQGDCLFYNEFVGTNPTALDQQAVGTGCVYPVPVQTIGNQLTENGLNWKGYFEDMGNIPSRESATCGHPALNSQDGTQTATAGDGYATRHNPFVYFHSVIDNAAYCNAHVVSFSGLANDLKRTETTPSLSFIVPNLCNDGHDFPCKSQASGASALADIDTFLSTWVPRITSSPAYKKNGLLVINFDEADVPGDASACCNETPGPNTPMPGITGLGGGRVGAVLLSPFIRAGTVSTTPYNHYSLLASIENAFGLPKLGYASTTSAIFGSDVFNR
jgi:phospholipase C